MESTGISPVVSSDKRYVEIELDRPTLALVVANLQHFADHYDDPGFMDRAAVFVAKPDIEDIAGKLRSLTDTAQDIVRIRLGWEDWYKYVQSVYYAGYVALDRHSGCVLERLYDLCSDMEDKGLAPRGPSSVS